MFVTFQAVAWCPWKPNLLATGGCGEEDGYIRIWNAATGKLVQEMDAGGEVSLCQITNHLIEIRICSVLLTERVL